jgi:hypothetical protein
MTLLRVIHVADRRHPVSKQKDEAAGPARCMMKIATAAMLGVCLLGCRPPEPVTVTELPRVPSLPAPSTLAGEPVPKTLGEALDTLERAAPGSFLAAMRRDDESVPISYHHGLGTWIRNNWGLWQRGPLYQDLARHGFGHPDEMSAAILDTFWRRQHGRPPDLEGRVRKEQEWAEESKQREGAIQQRVEAEQTRVRSMVMGLTLAPGTGPALRLPPRESDGLRARYLAPHGTGALIGVRTIPDRQGAFRIEPYQFDLATRRISPVRVRELDVVSSLLKVADTIWVTAAPMEPRGSLGATSRGCSPCSRGTPVAASRWPPCTETSRTGTRSPRLRACACPPSP